MSWDRVIQDSDEDEPLIEEDILTSIDPLQGHESPIQQHYNLGANHQEHYPIEHQDVSTEPQLSVNFDQFLQSQEGQHTTLNSSQQRREERWIPSTGEGGVGSIGACGQHVSVFKLTRLGTGAMMTEIGLAQQRLFDDEASSVVQRLPSTATAYSSEISQPGSFPTGPNYPYQQTNEVANDVSDSVKRVVYPSYEATQLVPSVQSVQAHGYEYSTPAASTTVDSPLGGYGETISYPATIQTADGLRAQPSQKATQRSKSLQSQPYSPHDTEPLSSVASPGVSRTKSDNVRSGLMSPRYSEVDTHDELSLPAVSVEVTTVKKRGLPKMHSVPDNDDDDELAIIQSGSGQSKPEKRKPGRPPKVACIGDAALNNTVAVGAEISAADGVTVTEPEVPVKAVPKETKKKKVRRSKTADALMQKSRMVDDDDVIWVDSKPIQVETKKPDAPPSEETPMTEDKPQSNQPEEKPAPKKRGRKRKMVSEQLTTEAESSKENQAPDAPAASGIPMKKAAEPTPEPPIPEPQEPVPANSAEQPPQPDVSSKQQTDPLPQTPQADTKTRKGPGAHSPISSTSKVPYRVGLSKRARIAPLLKVVRK